MEKLLKLHQSLLELSTKKTDIVIKGDMDALKQILKDEQAHIAAIGKFESERQKLTEAILPVIDKPSISDCIDAIVGTEKDTLSHLRAELLKTISKIKDKNELNQQMIHQSLQFVHLTMNLVVPQPMEFNYGPPSGKTPGQLSGLFSSKA
jgi:hypothetical protein